ncbi:MAG: hypothetical protein ABI572_09450 [Actinomycetota bacterium]
MPTLARLIRAAAGLLTSGMGVGLAVGAVFGDTSPSARVAYAAAAAGSLGVSFALYRSGGRGSERIWVTLAVAIVGLAGIAFAVQIRTWHGRGSWPAGGIPRNKVLVATWMASEMWVDPRSLLIGVAALVIAVAVFFAYPRLARDPSVGP